MKTCGLLTALVLALSLGGKAASAQEPPGTIKGIVLDEGGRPIVGAEVAAFPSALRARTDSAGRFSLSPLGSGSYRVRARHLGYLAEQITADLSDHGQVNVNFKLKVRPAILDTILVEADGSCSRFSFGGFNCRKHRDKGVFLTDDDIADRGAVKLGDVFGGVHGFRVDMVATEFGPDPVPIPTIGERCMTALVNGRPASITNQPPRWADELLGVEIYASPSDVPAEYKRYITKATPHRFGGTDNPGERCSLVVYWTAYEG